MMSNEEKYPEGWARLVLMVNPETEEIHIIGGDREPGEGDTGYLGAGVINRLTSLRYIKGSIPQINVSSIDDFTRRHVQVLDELEQIRARRNDGLRIIEEKREEIYELKKRIAELEGSKK